jgi:hypothetical protein
VATCLGQRAFHVIHVIALVGEWLAVCEDGGTADSVVLYAAHVVISDPIDELSASHGEGCGRVADPELGRVGMFSTLYSIIALACLNIVWASGYGDSVFDGRRYIASSSKGDVTVLV